jgi:hypothetical protein
MDIKEFKVVGKDHKKRNHPWEYARCKVIFDIIKPHINEFSKSSNVLDIGCGDLFFLHQFYRRFSGFNPIAIDTAFNDELISCFKNKYQDFPVDVYKNFQDARLRKGSANIVFLLDVIEHVENDRDFLEFLSCQSWATKDSLFVITAPAFNNLFCAHDKWLGHYRRYSHEELRKITENAGFQYIQGDYFFTTLLLARTIQKFMELLFKGKSENVKGIGDWNGGEISSFLFENILLSDYYLTKLLGKTGIKIPGLSTYILCKPQS